ncbi:hypothetical protein HQ393_15660 [Chitinibacter bivalviorum]|uniref:Uncharacterized protein n=1 Tax=Chitinibacter bivalviorum TaxID=2739434 RepID=A0A7H9BLL1_9NEIS|nr:hypothetical protein [Chitinibacter bivalviorum]QLG89567.1 hypothetical protein HQ393_15660 [Chitinibacter bivalviorum]
MGIPINCKWLAHASKLGNGQSYQSNLATYNQAQQQYQQSVASYNQAKAKYDQDLIAYNNAVIATKLLVDTRYGFDAVDNLCSGPLILVVDKEANCPLWPIT